MLELPNYSSNFFQQLWALMKDGHFCDCTILIGDNPHRAHKLVLAASSMLFRSLLTASDTITIDTEVVSSQEFGCLLDMVYTGKLPIGKHNASRIVAAADSLQMYDIAVAFKNILSRVVNQQLSKPEVDDDDDRERPESDHVSGSEPENIKSEKKKEMESESKNEPASKKPCLDTSVFSIAESSQKHLDQHNLAEPKEAFSDMEDIVELLSKAAASSLDEVKRQVVHQCCEEPGVEAVMEKLRCRVKDGHLSDTDILKVLHCVTKETSSPVSELLVSFLAGVSGMTVADKDASTELERVKGEEQQQDQQEELVEEEDQDKEEESPELTKDPASDAQRSLAFSCRWCKKGFSYNCRMLAHQKRCSMSQQQCPDCPKMLDSVKALQRHRAEEHGNEAANKKKAACDICGRTFAHPSGMIYHKRTEHFEERPFVCEKCGSKFAANSSLKNHKRLHTGEKPYECKQCDMRFSVAAALAYHTKKKHSEGKMYECQYCKVAFAQSIELTRHVRTHTGDRPYVCRECGKGYSQASGLTVHLQSAHNMTEPYDCPKCCLTFTSLEEHQEHVEKFHKECHQCHECDKIFYSAAMLDKHKNTHTVSKHLRCDLCNKTYQQLSGLWYHNRTNHPDVFANQTRQLKSLLQCNLCFKFFPSATSVAKHRATEHEGSLSMHQCMFCPAVLAGEEELQEHVTSQHDMGQSSVVVTSQQELQEHVASCQADLQTQRQDGNLSPGRVVLASPAVEALVQHEAQQVFVTMAEGKEGSSSSEVVEVNMYDLLNSAVTFICESK